jgi:3-oxoadipate enol-lactonase
MMNVLKVQRKWGIVEQFNHNGITISYSDFGTGARTLLFLHGTGGNRAYFEAQFEHFKRDYRVIACDLRGHGESTKPKTGYDVSAFSSDILALLNHLDVSSAVLIGHSLGGMIALDLAVCHPERVHSIAILDSPILMYPQVAEALTPFVEAFASSEYPNAIRQFATQFFFSENTADELRSRVLNDLERFPQHIFGQIFGTSAQYDAEAALRKLKLPATYIHASVPADLERMHELAPFMQIERLESVGHFAQVERADKINDLIRRFILQQEQTQSAHL